MYSPPSQKRTATPNGIIVVPEQTMVREIESQPWNISVVPSKWNLITRITSGFIKSFNRAVGCIRIQDPAMAFPATAIFAIPCVWLGVYVIPASVVGITGSVVKEAFL